MSDTRYMITEETLCGTCVHYRQHYILGQGNKMWPLWYGHCVFPRLKRRRPDEVCPHWQSNSSTNAEGPL